MYIPPAIKDSSLYLRLAEDAELLTSLLSLRTIAERLAETIAHSVPNFTDHSIRHMDALWAVTGRVLTQSEIASLTTAEAFLLASGFYLHDIGMAYAATEEGLQKCRSSSQYKSFLASCQQREDPCGIEAQALTLAVRKIHATAAVELATEPIPGTSIYLFEAKTFRDEWAQTCGHIAASHHWTLEQVDSEFGSGGTLPLPGGRKGDLGYIASVLRIVDYAHINRDRAPTLDRAFRHAIGRESLVHWLAQEHVDGPEREGNDLLYRAARPIRDVEAWWLYYEMLVGLDAEIRSVRRYLGRRPGDLERFTLQGVRGSATPQEAAVYIPPAGFLPIEVNLRTGSIDRLVRLLAGESLYGPDSMSTVRELIQNARDAVMLKAASDPTEVDRAMLSLPIRVALTGHGANRMLEVTDWGVGMNQKIMTDYLISIASDYWSSQYFSDFPKAVERGFQPAGKFGIGFLSVFMLGDEVTVESNRSGGERLQLTLRGVGRRGELRALATTTGSGTSVRVRLKPQIPERLSPLADLVRIYAPMLAHSMVVEDDEQITEIPRGWLFELTGESFRDWVLKALQTLLRNRGDRSPQGGGFFWSRRGVSRQAEEIWANAWPEYADSSTRLIASFEGTSLLCLRGLAIQPIPTPGFVGVADLDSATTDVSRQQVIHADVASVLQKARTGARAQIVKHIDSLIDNGFVLDKLDFIDSCVSVYGREVLRESSLPWISRLVPPGEVGLINSEQLIAELNSRRSLFLAFDTGPWTAMKKWASSISSTRSSSDKSFAKSEVALVLNATGHWRPQYQSSNLVKTGTLAELWPEYSRNSLFYFLLLVAAEAWQVNSELFDGQPGWQHEGTTLWGRITRP